jgi:hypothetical protein
MVSELGQSNQPLEHRMRRMTMEVYSILTLIGVVIAAAWKSYATDVAELIAIVLGTSVAIVIAHAWASVFAHRAVRRERFTKADALDELTHIVSFLVPCAIIIVLSLVLNAMGIDVDGVATLDALALMGFLLIVGTIAARRVGCTWPRSLMWGVADFSIGGLILLLKILIG